MEGREQEGREGALPSLLYLRPILPPFALTLRRRRKRERMVRKGGGDRTGGRGWDVESERERERGREKGREGGRKEGGTDGEAGRGRLWAGAGNASGGEIAQ